MTAVIIPTGVSGPHRTHYLKELTAQGVSDLLGFTPNVEDDPDKVKYSWGFTVDGVPCGVWDFKGSSAEGCWSAYGTTEALSRVFGGHLVGG